MNEWQLSPPLRIVLDRASAAIFVLRAHAAKKVDGRVGLGTDIRRFELQGLSQSKPDVPRVTLHVVEWTVVVSRAHGCEFS